jgi:hypothetical protein
VWKYFDSAGPMGRRWPIAYRLDEAQRIDTLRHFGVRRFTSLIYAHNRTWPAGCPVIIHCGSGPEPGPHAGPQPIWQLLQRYRTLRLIIAHMGMPEYTEFLDICEKFPNVCLDTTMVFTPFTDELMPFPDEERPRLHDLGDRILFGSDFPNIPYVYSCITGTDEPWDRR